MKTRKTQEQFLKEIEKLVGNEYSVLGSYINDSTKILIKHKILNLNTKSLIVNTKV